LNTSDKNTFAVWKMKILKQIFGPVSENGLWKIRTMMDLYRELDIIS
jgi:hypothetical protein